MQIPVRQISQHLQICEVSSRLRCFLSFTGLQILFKENDKMFEEEVLTHWRFG